MKNSIFFTFSLLVLMISTPSFAQEDKTIRPSPPAEAKGMIDSVHISINYSSPSVKGRQVWGSLVPYGQVWRTGANEATVFETNKALIIEGQKLPAGKYALFSIPGEKEWTIIFNSTWNQWGSFKYDATKDVLRIKANAEHSPVFHERMLFEIKGNTIVLSWENLMVSFKAKG